MKLSICAAAVIFVVGSAGFAAAQGTGLPGLPNIGAAPDSSMAHNGAGVFHGNYCGVGDRGVGLPPTDALDRACMHHDACTPSGGLPSCGCNARFKRETHAVAVSRHTPDDLRALASTVEAGIPLIPCR